MSFNKMLVSATRAGEGEPITGLKPSGYDVGPAIPGADRALESASLDVFAGMLSAEIDVTLQKQLQ